MVPSVDTESSVHTMMSSCMHCVFQKDRVVASKLLCSFCKSLQPPTSANMLCCFIPTCLQVHARVATLMLNWRNIYQRPTFGQNNLRSGAKDELGRSLTHSHTEKKMHTFTSHTSSSLIDVPTSAKIVVGTCLHPWLGFQPFSSARRHLDSQENSHHRHKSEAEHWSSTPRTQHVRCIRHARNCLKKPLGCLWSCLWLASTLEACIS